jgi:hypothetical protein
MSEMLNRADPLLATDPGFFTTPGPTIGTWVRGGVSDGAALRLDAAEYASARAGSQACEGQA